MTGTGKDTPAKAWLRALDLSARLARREDATLAALVEAFAGQTPDAPALLSADACLSYGDLAARARRYTRWALAQSYPDGTAVGLLAHNRPEYVAAWIGLVRAGVAVALLSPQLAPEGLAHGLAAADLRALIFDSRCAPLACAVVETGVALELWALDPGVEDGGGLALDLERFPAGPLAVGEAPRVAKEASALLIFTSGTTGLPKAAHVSHARILAWSGWFAGLMDASPVDRLYDCLPMHHSVGGVVAVGAMLAAGGSVVVRDRFSVTRFWSEVCDWRCTLLQYVGDLCAHLVAAPPTPDEGRHQIRLACGNGLDAGVWPDFQARFRIPQILEFYAATEGVFSLFNVEGEPGSIGRIPAFLRHRFPAALFRFDLETAAPARAPAGLCIPCARGDVGEALGRIADDPSRTSGASRFEGYTDEAATTAKIVRDVEVRGDAWFRTGDLMRQDARGFFYFVDRIGDTFRWKGENVSTTEVERALRGLPGVLDAVVFGTAVPGREGRAGMLALVADANFDLVEAREAFARRLAPFARPVFVRVVPTIERTETLKPKKARLAAEGFDPSVVFDPLFFDDRDAGAYRVIDVEAFASIIAGRKRL